MNRFQEEPKSTSHPHTTKPGGAYQEGHPDRVKARGRQEELKKE